MRKCTKCKISKEITEFILRPERKSGYYPRCKSCKNAQIRNSRLKQAYKIDTEIYNKLLLSQGGRCAICYKLPVQNNLSVDHDHNTGKIRGLLCVTCNGALGWFGDSIDGITNVIKYLTNSNY